MNIGYYSHLSAALVFIMFTVLLLFTSFNSRQGKILSVVMMIHAVWALLAVNIARGDLNQFGAYHVFETIRYIAWYSFFYILLTPLPGQTATGSAVLRRALVASIGFGLFFLLGELASSALLAWFEREDIVTLWAVGHIFLAIIGLAIIEQLYRNTSLRQREAVKYMFLGVGGIFVYDLFLYSQALLYRGIDREIWEVRGAISVLVVPLLALTTARSKDWATNIFVSRQAVLSTTAILGAGIYLMVMAAVGFYLKEFGGGWGRAAQILFFSLAVLLLVAVMLSGHLRAQALVFLGKHFYRNKYDYRREWLRLTKKLDASYTEQDRLEAVIQVFANITDARSGLLFIKGRKGYENVAAWRAKRISKVGAATNELALFLDETGYIVNMMEFESHRNEYRSLKLPEWVSSLERPWLIVPLYSPDALIGFVVLANPFLVRDINWEDRDLLKTVAKQVSSYLAVIKTSQALSEARQFEVFNRLSAYMVHDLKNIAAELQLIAHNADKHKDKPEFLDDAFATVNHAAAEIGRLLEQLRGNGVQAGKKVHIDLCTLLQEVMSKKQGNYPVPEMEAHCSAGLVLAEKNRLMNVLLHLLDNAQQATPDSGFVKLSVVQGDASHVIRIRDNGCGMDAEFIQKRLFNPFDTTKGNAGMGIGMYESREFIYELGGEMHVESEPGKGTLIEVHIPALKEAG